MATQLFPLSTLPGFQLGLEWDDRNNRVLALRVDNDSGRTVRAWCLIPGVPEGQTTRDFAPSGVPQRLNLPNNVLSIGTITEPGEDPRQVVVGWDGYGMTFVN